MNTRVLSFRLPAAMLEALTVSAVDAEMSISSTLDWLLRHSVGHSDLLRDLEDCPECDSIKLDARLPASTVHFISIAASDLRVPRSVYIRKLLYHFYLTRRLEYVQSDGRYTLAYRYD